MQSVDDFRCAEADDAFIFGGEIRTEVKVAVEDACLDADVVVAVEQGMFSPVFCAVYVDFDCSVIVFKSEG